MPSLVRTETELARLASRPHQRRCHCRHSIACRMFEAMVEYCCRKLHPRLVEIKGPEACFLDLRSVADDLRGQMNKRTYRKRKRNCGNIKGRHGFDPIFTRSSDVMYHTIKTSASLCRQEIHCAIYTIVTVPSSTFPFEQYFFISSISSLLYG